MRATLADERYDGALKVINGQQQEIAALNPKTRGW